MVAQVVQGQYIATQASGTRQGLRLRANGRNRTETANANATQRIAKCATQSMNSLFFSAPCSSLASARFRFCAPLPSFPAAMSVGARAPPDRPTGTKHGADFLISAPAAVVGEGKQAPSGQPRRVGQPACPRPRHSSSSSSDSIKSDVRTSEPEGGREGGSDMDDES